MISCTYVDPANPNQSKSGYCDANGVPIARSSPEAPTTL